MHLLFHHQRRAAQAAWLLSPGLGLLLWVACAVPPRPPGTRMKTSCPAEIEMPTVEECREEAWKIQGNDLLRTCMLSQCRSIQVTCNEWGRIKCAERTRASGFVRLAVTLTPMETTWYNPAKETYWCEEAASHKCIVKIIIHEVAHSCGWLHGMNPSVPGNVESEPPCECIQGNDRAGPCK